MAASFLNSAEINAMRWLARKAATEGTHSTNLLTNNIIGPHGGSGKRTWLKKKKKKKTNKQGMNGTRRRKKTENIATALEIGRERKRQSISDLNFSNH